MIHRKLLVSIFAGLTLGQVALAEVVTENGVTYNVTRSVVQRPVSETQFIDRQHTVYSERLSTEYHAANRTVYTPVTEYSWEPYMANRWNPFANPSVAYRYVPRTRWEARNEELQIPVTRREMVPEQRTVRTAVVNQRLVPVEHITRVPMSGTGGDPFAGTAGKPIGGVATLQNDPPRQPATDSVLMRK